MSSIKLVLVALFCCVISVLMSGACWGALKEAVEVWPTCKVQAVFNCLAAAVTVLTVVYVYAVVFAYMGE